MSFNVFSTKLLIEGSLYFYDSYWRRNRHFTRSSRLQAVQEKFLHFSQYFKTLSIGPTMGIDSALESNADPIELILQDEAK